MRVLFDAFKELKYSKLPELNNEYNTYARHGILVEVSAELNLYITIVKVNQIKGLVVIYNVRNNFPWGLIDWLIDILFPRNIHTYTSIVHTDK